ncbi:unnamed protein product [Parajaminaea phylloscopi]
MAAEASSSSSARPPSNPPTPLPGSLTRSKQSASQRTTSTGRSRPSSVESSASSGFARHLSRSIRSRFSSHGGTPIISASAEEDNLDVDEDLWDKNETAFFEEIAASPRLGPPGWLAPAASAREEPEFAATQHQERPTVAEPVTSTSGRSIPAIGASAKRSSGSPFSSSGPSRSRSSKPLGSREPERLPSKSISHRKALSGVILDLDSDDDDDVEVAGDATGATGQGDQQSDPRLAASSSSSLLPPQPSHGRRSHLHFPQTPTEEREERSWLEDDESETESFEPSQDDDAASNQQDSDGEADLTVIPPPGVAMDASDPAGLQVMLGGRQPDPYTLAPDHRSVAPPRTETWSNTSAGYTLPESFAAEDDIELLEGRDRERRPSKAEVLSDCEPHSSKPRIRDFGIRKVLSSDTLRNQWRSAGRPKGSATFPQRSTGSTDVSHRSGDDTSESSVAGSPRLMGGIKKLLTKRRTPADTRASTPRNVSPDTFLPSQQQHRPPNASPQAIAISSRFEGADYNPQMSADKAAKASTSVPLGSPDASYAERLPSQSPQERHAPRDQSLRLAGPRKSPRKVVSPTSSQVSSAFSTHQSAASYTSRSRPPEAVSQTSNSDVSHWQKTEELRRLHGSLQRPSTASSDVPLSFRLPQPPSRQSPTTSMSSRSANSAWSHSRRIGMPSADDKLRHNISSFLGGTSRRRESSNSRGSIIEHISHEEARRRSGSLYGPISVGSRSFDTRRGSVGSSMTGATGASGAFEDDANMAGYPHRRYRRPSQTSFTTGAPARPSREGSIHYSTGGGSGSSIVSWSNPWDAGRSISSRGSSAYGSGSYAMASGKPPGIFASIDALASVDSHGREVGNADEPASSQRLRRGSAASSNAASAVLRLRRGSSSSSNTGVSIANGSQKRWSSIFGKIPPGVIGSASSLIGKPGARIHPRDISRPVSVVGSTLSDGHEDFVVPSSSASSFNEHRESRFRSGSNASVTSGRLGSSLSGHAPSTTPSHMYNTWSQQQKHVAAAIPPLQSINNRDIPPAFPMPVANSSRMAASKSAEPPYTFSSTGSPSNSAMEYPIVSAHQMPAGQEDTVSSSSPRFHMHSGRRPTFGLDLQPDAAAAFDSIPSPHMIKVAPIPSQSSFDSHRRGSNAHRALGSGATRPLDTYRDPGSFGDEEDGRNDPRRVQSVPDWHVERVPDDKTDLAGPSFERLTLDAFAGREDGDGLTDVSRPAGRGDSLSLAAIPRPLPEDTPLSPGFRADVDDEADGTPLSHHLDIAESPRTQQRAPSSASATDSYYQDQFEDMVDPVLTAPCSEERPGRHRPNNASSIPLGSRGLESDGTDSATEDDADAFQDVEFLEDFDSQSASGTSQRTTTRSPGGLRVGSPSTSLKTALRRRGSDRSGHETTDSPLSSAGASHSSASRRGSNERASGFLAPHVAIPSRKSSIEGGAMQTCRPSSQGFQSYPSAGRRPSTAGSPSGSWV